MPAPRRRDESDEIGIKGRTGEAKGLTGTALSEMKRMQPFQAAIPCGAAAPVLRASAQLASRFIRIRPPAGGAYVPSPRVFRLRATPGDTVRVPSVRLEQSIPQGISIISNTSCAARPRASRRCSPDVALRERPLARPFRERAAFLHPDSLADGFIYLHIETISCCNPRW